MLFYTTISILFSSGFYNKIPYTGGLKQRTFISYSSRVLEVEDYVPAVSDPGESQLPGWLMDALLLCPHVAESTLAPVSLPSFVRGLITSWGPHIHELIQT